MPNPTFKFSNGSTIKLRPIPGILLTALLMGVQNQELEPPLTERTMGVKQELRVYPDYSNPEYKAAVETSKTRALMKLMEVLVKIGVASDIPEGERVAYTTLSQYTYGDRHTPDKARYLWIMANLRDEQELERFQEAVIGLSQPTPTGEEAAMERFHGDD